MKHQQTAYALARLPIGLSFLGHGLVRIPKLTAFAEGMAGGFQETILPEGIVLIFAYALPIIELLLGIALILGIRMRQASMFGVFLICALIFGSSLQENWSGVATQMFYGLYLSVLYLFADYNAFSPLPSQKTS